MTLSRDEAMRRLHEITEGINADESEDDAGWWETSSGVAFGADRLAELEQLIRDLTP